MANLHDRKKFFNELYQKQLMLESGLEFQVESLSQGEAKISIPLTGDKHRNIYGYIHGGVFTALSDTVMGMACSTLQNGIVTLEMNSNFIKNVPKGDAVFAWGKVVHAGSKTLVAEAEIRDSEQNLLVQSRGTFWVVTALAKQGEVFLY